MHDMPDYSKYGHIVTFQPSTDVNELAAKLNSPSTNFREGQTIYQTDFRDGTKGLDPEFTGGISEIYIDETSSTMTGLTLIMVTTSDEFDECYIGKELPIFDTRYYIYSMLFTGLLNNVEYWVEFYIVKDGVRYYPQLKYNAEDKELSILKNDDTWEVLALERDIFRGPGMNIRIHFKVDIQTGYYVSVYLNDDLIDLSSYQMKSAVTADVEYTTIYFSVRKVSGVTATGYLNALSLACSNE